MRQYGGTERLEAALVEMGQGMTYPATPDFEPAVLAGLERVKGRWPRWVPYPRVLRPRLILTIAIALALLAAVAAAAYVGVQTWLSAGPRDVQFTSDFQLGELFRAEPGVEYQHLAIGPEGKEIYAVRLHHPASSGELDIEKTGIARMYGLREERVQTELVLKSNDLKAPSLWAPGTDLSGTMFVECCSFPEGKLSVASNGDLFFLARASTGTTFSQIVGSVPTGTSLIVRQADGKLQMVLTIRELVDAGLLHPAATDQHLENALAASAPDRLWLLIQGSSGEMIFRRFYAVEDPNGDGDWSDRAVIPLSLPDFVGAGDGRWDEIPWFFQQMIAEPSLAGEERSRSFLLQMRSLAGEHRIYRVSDDNSDGDALDAGEFELLFSGVPALDEVLVAPRIVVRDGEVALRELVVSSFTTTTRVSRITETGEVIDIARAFEYILDVVADAEGNIYVWAFPPDGGPGPVLYKLKPVVEGMGGEPEVRSRSNESLSH